MTVQTTISSEEMITRATEAAALLKALSHEGRLMILCHLSGGERTVGELELLLGQRQAAVSQQLARLRADGLVTCRADGKARLYSVSDPKAAEVIATVYRLFCEA
ncbi:MAG: metalloregulator ArsR/SmtB family transcription factor [Paracoccus sp. (in: a-proteobacteria)]|nr:metalloregulator ArsR/SmtB family transcription factor [Paracoccus sp. (in: a-proteobacteria)]